MDISKLADSTIVIGGIDTRDYPDFSDSYVEYAEWLDGTPLTDEELECLADEHRDLVYEMTMSHLF